MTLLNVGLTLMFLMIRKWVSNASHEIEVMMGLKMRWIETETMHGGRGKIPDLMELWSLKITVEDMEGKFHLREMAAFHNLHPFPDAASSTLYVDFETIS